MQETAGTNDKFQRAVGDLVVAEMLLLQAGIESAGAISRGVHQLGRQLASRRQSRLPVLGGLLQRTADEALEPFTTRLTYLRNWRDQDI